MHNCRLRLIATLIIGMGIYFNAFSDPTIDSLTPHNPRIGDTVVITGSGFDTNNLLANKVYFNNQRYVFPPPSFAYDSIQANVIAVSSNIITVIAPLGASSGHVSVSVNGLNSDSEVYYSIIPTITSFAPSTGSIGDTILITGTGFNWGQVWSNRVIFTNGSDTYAISATPTSIKVIVPHGAITGPIEILSTTSLFNFTVIPLVHSLGYNSGEVGQSVTIFGSGFDPTQLTNYQVTFNGVQAGIKVIYPTFIETTVPHLASSGPVILFFKEAKVIGPDLYFIVNPTQPEIFEYSVYSGNINTPISIIGRGFDQSGPPLTVHFGDAVAKIERYNQDTIHTTVPRGALSGPISVTAGGVSTNGFNLTFRVLEKVDFVTHRHAKVGDTITVIGTGFSYLPEDYYQVGFFHSINTTVRALATDTTLSFIVPETATSGTPVIFSDYNLSVFIELPYLGIIPTISSISPDTVISGRNQQITIVGTGFGRTPETKQYEIVFGGNIVQKNISDNGYGDMPNNRFVEIRTTVPSTAMTGHVSLIIDSLIAVSPLNLVVLPDTFPYKPNPPLILTSTSITSTSFISHWNRPYRALGFLLDISIDNFSTFLIGFNSANVTDTLKSISGLLEGTEYRLRIRAYSDTDTSDYSHRITFTIPPAPVALTPRIVGPLEFLVQWSDSRGADGYKLDLSIDHFITHESINVIENSLGIRVLNSELPFFEYRVRAYNTSGISDYSNIINVLVTDAKLRTGEIFLSPNPATDYVNINGMPHQVIESFLIDNLGRVRRVNLQKENNDSLVLDVRTLGEGLYFLQLVTPQSIIQLKFIKL